MTPLSRTTASRVTTTRPLAATDVPAPPCAPVDRLLPPSLTDPRAPERIRGPAPGPGLETHGVAATAAQLRAELDRAGGPREGPLEGRLRALDRACKAFVGALTQQAGQVLEAADGPLAEARAALRGLASRPDAPPGLTPLAHELDFLGSWLLERRLRTLEGEARLPGPRGEAARADAHALLLGRAEALQDFELTRRVAAHARAGSGASSAEDRLPAPIAARLESVLADRVGSAARRVAGGDRDGAGRLSFLLGAGGEVALRAAEAVLGPVPPPRGPYDSSGPAVRWQRALDERVDSRAVDLHQLLFHLRILDASLPTWSPEMKRELALPELDPVAVLRALERGLGRELGSRERLEVLEHLESVPSEAPAR
jgi:hypothetical protein